MAIETKVFVLSEVLNSEERIAAYLEEIFANQEIKTKKPRRKNGNFAKSRMASVESFWPNPEWAHLHKLSVCHAAKGFPLSDPRRVGSLPRRP